MMMRVQPLTKRSARARPIGPDPGPTLDPGGRAAAKHITVGSPPGAQEEGERGTVTEDARMRERENVPRRARRQGQHNHKQAGTVPLTVTVPAQHQRVRVRVRTAVKQAV
jgi:hypothetical protein